MPLTFPRKSTAVLQLFCLTNAVCRICYQSAAVSTAAESGRLGFCHQSEIEEAKVHPPACGDSRVSVTISAIEAIGAVSAVAATIVIATVAAIAAAEPAIPTCKEKKNIGKVSGCDA